MPERTADLWWLFTRQTLCVTQEESVVNAALLMQRRNFRHLPVISSSSKKIVGIISAQDVIDSLALINHADASDEAILRSLEIPVHRIMSLHPIVVEKGDGLTEVVKKLVSHNIGALPVVDERGLVQGIITLRDLVGLLGTDSEPMGLSVSEVMTEHIITINPDSWISDAVHRMSESRIRRLPVVDAGTPSSPTAKGVLTNKDVLRLLAKAAIKDRDSGREHRSESTSLFQMKVSECMTAEAISVDSSDDVRIAASRMMIFGIGGLTVLCSTSKREMCGLVTERDLVKKICKARSVNFIVEAMKFELEVKEASFSN